MTNLPSSSIIRDIILEMKDELINRDAIEKLGSLIPTDEEIAQIKHAKLQNPDTPLGTAEEFLLGKHENIKFPDYFNTNRGGAAYLLLTYYLISILIWPHFDTYPYISI